MSTPKKPRAAVLGVVVGALATSGLAVAAPASAASPDVVINEVYGGGGNTGATLTNDFIELQNNSSQAVSVTGWSVQYASAAGTSWQTTPLTGTIAPGGRYLVQQAAGTGGTVPLTGPNSIGSIPMSGTSGKVALVTGSAALTCGADCDTAAGVRDFVGYGAANDSEGAATPALTSTTSVARTGTADTDDNQADFAVGSPTPNSSGVTADPPAEPEEPARVCAEGTIPVGDVQGSGSASPCVGETVTVAGTVVGDLQDGGFDGFFVQDAGDGDTATSDGVFVYDPNGVSVAPGDRVTVTGTVSEFREITQIGRATVTVGDAGELPAATTLPLPSTDAQREALEGMLVAPTEDLTVTEVYDLNRYGEIMLAQGGRLITPTETAEPGAEATAAAAANAARSLLLDDGRTTDLSRAGETPPHLTLDDPVRVGDTAVLEPVVLSYGFDAWRLQPADGTAAGTTFPATNPRPATPDEVVGDLRIADFNVLNYFVQFGAQARGATSAEELAQQQAKIVTAITALDADIITLHEIENSAKLTPETPYRALETLVAALNAAEAEQDGIDTWRFVRAHEASDVITNAIIYRVNAAQPLGVPSKPAEDAVWDNAREPIAQTFRSRGEVFTVIANHLKSKSSGTGVNADQGDGQGASNPDRVAQAQSLVAFAAQVAANAGDTDVLLTGDFNAYRTEDPLDVIRDAGYTEVFEADEYSYVFDGGSGSLDHVFASPSMLPKITGHTVWDINSVESYAYQYDGFEGLYAPYAYRASDHNPTLVGVDTKSGTPADGTDG